MNELDGNACKRLYLYIAERQKGVLGYYDMAYYDMASRLGLPWHTGTVRALRRALEILILHDLIRVKPSERRNCVRLRLRMSPRRAAEEHGPWWLDDLLETGTETVDPWAVFANG